MFEELRTYFRREQARLEAAITQAQTSGGLSPKDIERLRALHRATGEQIALWTRDLREDDRCTLQAVA
ncbi:hypothetical protein WBP07_20790 (plasmid) [Novosphingobium sp. BL-8A]|uniref:hypothetical protein n=1 Tax=Novosphingobium sp. BL-8A TaxID=3127639 RepID=UPI003756FBEC